MQKDKKKIFLASSILLVFIISLISAFDVDNVFIKLSIKQQEPIYKTIKVTNTESKKQDFEINSDLEFLSVKEKSFSLDAGESKNIELIFVDEFHEEGIEAGVYLGELSISNYLQTKEIPIILEVETKEVLFDINLNVPPEYSNVYPGEKAIIETKIFNLEKIGLKTIEMNYFVKDFNNDIIFSEQENLVVETQILTTKTIPIPENAQIGNYVFIAIAKYNSDSIGTSSYSFRIMEKKSHSFIEKNIIYVITGLVIVILMIIMLVIYSIKQRDKVFLQLERQYRRDLKNRIQKLEKREVRAISVLKNKKEKRAIKKGFKKIKKQKIKIIKKIQKKRLKKLKQLQKSKKKNEMQRQIEKWKKQGYDTSILEPGKHHTFDSIKKQIKDWKEKGYNTKILEEELNRKV